MNPGKLVFPLQGAKSSMVFSPDTRFQPLAGRATRRGREHGAVTGGRAASRPAVASNCARSSGIDEMKGGREERGENGSRRVKGPQLAVSGICTRSTDSS